MLRVSKNGIEYIDATHGIEIETLRIRIGPALLGSDDMIGQDL